MPLWLNREVCGGFRGGRSVSRVVTAAASCTPDLGDGPHLIEVAERFGIEPKRCGAALPTTLHAGAVGSRHGVRVCAVIGLPSVTVTSQYAPMSRRSDSVRPVPDQSPAVRLDTACGANVRSVAFLLWRQVKDRWPLCLPARGSMSLMSAVRGSRPGVYSKRLGTPSQTGQARAWR
jgi:hypothetical protein